MKYARRQLNATVLPDGRVLATGGTSATGFNNAAGSVLTPELWDPVKNTWTEMAPMKVARLYHSTAVLLPDGRVFSSGGGEGGAGKIEMNGEFLLAAVPLQRRRKHARTFCGRPGGRRQSQQSEGLRLTL
jgi:hypothetical protein